MTHQPSRPCLYHPALAAAANLGNLENVEILLECAVGIGTPCSVSALQTFISDLPILQKLLEAGLPVDVPDNLASFTCIPHLDPDMELRISPLQSFATSRNDQAVQLLLKHGANPNCRGVVRTHWSDGTEFIMESVISTVAANCGTEVVEALLEAGVVINPPVLGDFERTPLQNAAEHGKVDNVELLLRAGADVNAPASQYRGVTALQAAALGGTLGIAIRLLEAGADANAPEAKENGYTALVCAALNGRIDMIRLLLNAGADIESPDFGVPQYESAVKVAREGGHNAATRLLERYRSTLTAG